MRRRGIELTVDGHTLPILADMLDGKIKVYDSRYKVLIGPIQRYFKHKSAKGHLVVHGILDYEIYFINGVYGWVEMKTNLMEDFKKVQDET